MKLLNAIFISLIVDVLGSWVGAIYLVSQSEPTVTVTWLLGFTLSIAANMLLGILLTVCLFSVLKKKIGSSQWLVKYLAQTGLVLLIMAIGVCLGTIGGASAFTPEELKHEFDSYKGYFPVVLAVSFLTPLVYYWVSRLAWSPQNINR